MCKCFIGFAPVLARGVLVVQKEPLSFPTATMAIRIDAGTVQLAFRLLVALKSILRELKIVIPGSN